MTQQANKSESKAEPKAEVKVRITHGNYVHVPATRLANGEIDASVPYGHDIPAVPGDVISLPKAEAERLIAGGTAALA